MNKDKILTTDIVKEAFTTNLFKNVSDAFPNFMLNKVVSKEHINNIAEINKDFLNEINKELNLFVSFINDIIEKNGTIDINVIQDRDIYGALCTNNVSLRSKDSDSLLSIIKSFNKDNFEPIKFINILAGLNIVLKSVIDCNNYKFLEKHMLDYHIQILREKDISANYCFREELSKNKLSIENILKNSFQKEHIYQEKIRELFRQIEKEDVTGKLTIADRVFSDEYLHSKENIHFLLGGVLSVNQVLLLSTIDFLKQTDKKILISKNNKDMFFENLISLLTVVGNYFHKYCHEETNKKASIFDEVLTQEQLDILLSRKKFILEEKWIVEGFQLLIDYAQHEPENMLNKCVGKMKVLDELPTNNKLKNLLSKVEEVLFISMSNKNQKWFESFQEQIDECKKRKILLKLVSSENLMGFKIWQMHKRANSVSGSILSNFKENEIMKLEINIYELESLGNVGFSNIKNYIKSIMFVFPEDIKKDLFFHYTPETEIFCVELNKNKYGEYLKEIVEVFITVYSKILSEDDISDINKVTIFKNYNDTFICLLREKILDNKIKAKDINLEFETDRSVQRKKI